MLRKQAFAANVVKTYFGFFIGAMIAFAVIPFLIIGLAFVTDNLMIIFFGILLMFILPIGIILFFVQKTTYSPMGGRTKFVLKLLLGIPLFWVWFGLCFFAGPESIFGITGWMFRAGAFAIILIYSIWLWMKYGKEPKIDYSAKYETEPPYDYSPAILGSLEDIENQLPDLDDFIATIFYFVGKGLLKIDKIETTKTFLFMGKEITDYEITFLNKKIDLPAYDLKAYNLLKEMSKNNKLTFGKIGLFLQAEVAKYQRELRDWADLGKKSAFERGLFNKDVVTGRMNILLFFSVGLLLLSAFMQNAIFGEFSFQLIAMVLPLRWIMKKYFKSRTPEGALQYARWLAFKKYIEDHSDFAKKLPDEIELWGQYITYAVSLGVSEGIMNQMGFKYSGEFGKQYIPTGMKITLIENPEFTD